MNPPIERGKPVVNAKTGEITLEYEFPEPGDAEAYGEVMNKTAIEAKHERFRKCKGGYIRKGKKCVKGGPTRYGRTRLKIAAAGTYKLHIRPSTKVLAALKKGKTLTVRLEVVFTPTGTTDHISKTTTVRVRLKRAPQGTQHAGGKR
jgi:VCBS repeat-containing protein